jgi:hypothetical protein
MSGPELDKCLTELLQVRHLESFYKTPVGVDDSQLLGSAFVRGGVCVGYMGILTTNTGLEWATITLADGEAFRAIWFRHVKRLLEIFKSSGLKRTICQADDSKVGVDLWLSRLGFAEIINPVPEELILAEGKRLFEWK